MLTEIKSRWGNSILENGGNGLITAGEFKAKLKAAKWSQKQISKALGYDSSWLSKIVHGARKMKTDDLVSICKLTGIPPNVLLGWNNPEPIPKGADDDIFRKFVGLLTADQRERFKAVLENYKE